MQVARNVVFEPKLLPGGGALEMAISVGLAERALPPGRPGTDLRAFAAGALAWLALAAGVGAAALGVKAALACLAAGQGVLPPLAAGLLLGLALKPLLAWRMLRNTIWHQVLMLAVAAILEGIGRQVVTSDGLRVGIGLAALGAWLVYYYGIGRRHALRSPE
jgi:hypothetical protein